MENKYSRMLEKSVVDLLQYSEADIEDAICLTFETILKAEQSEYLGYEKGSRTKKITSANKRSGSRSIWA
ncbi:MAG: hypothetical protein GKR87_12635 [Kiritimatiellae bacterium]|nr:hypothetical protein [Kiritimatiellia bacterium]